MLYSDYQLICKKHSALMDTFGYIYIKGKRVGKVYYKMATDYYHSETATGKKLEGQSKFEDALLLLISTI
jgi:uncharacterized protein (UPF0332 family)